MGPPQVRNRSRVDDPQAVASPHQALPAPSWCRFITAGRRKSSFSAINTTTDRPGRSQKSSSPPRLRRHEGLRITRPSSRQRPPHPRDTASRSRAVTLGPRQASFKNRTRQSAATKIQPFEQRLPICLISILLALLDRRLVSEAPVPAHTKLYPPICGRASHETLSSRGGCRDLAPPPPAPVTFVPCPCLQRADTTRLPTNGNRRKLLQHHSRPCPCVSPARRSPRARVSSPHPVAESHIDEPAAFQSSQRVRARDAPS